jgi:hypothetical protein
MGERRYSSAVRLRNRTIHLVSELIKESMNSYFARKQLLISAVSYHVSGLHLYRLCPYQEH